MSSVVGPAISLDPDRIAAARSVSSQDWLSDNARSLVALACFAGFDRDDLLIRIAKHASQDSRHVNVSTVVTVLDQIERGE